MFACKFTTPTPRSLSVFVQNNIWLSKLSTRSPLTAGVQLLHYLLLLLRRHYSFSARLY